MSWPAIVAKQTAAMRRLGRMSAEECRVRGTQEIKKYAERVFGMGQGELSDRAFRSVLSRQRRGDQRDMTIRQFLQGLREKPFIPGLADRDATVALMDGRFQVERAALLARAERAMQGRFDLLGFRDLFFGTPIDWCLEPLSDKRTPLDHWTRIPYLNGGVVGDKKIVWELNRHGHFVTLGQAYWITGDERYADAFVNQLNAWLDANPPRRGINWASTLEVSFRSMAWLWAVRLFVDSPRLTPNLVWRLLKALAQHGRYIDSYLSHYFSPNTHLTGEALGLFYLGTILTVFREADAWRDRGLTILLDQLPKQVREDGVYFEQSSYYHRYTVDFYLHLALLARSGGVTLPSCVDRILPPMLDHLMWITRPDGHATLYGDEDGGRLMAFSSRAADDFRDTLAVGAVVYGRPDWKYVAGESVPEVLWLTGPDGLRRWDALVAAEPCERSRQFTVSGYAVLRNGWSRSASYVFFDAGTHGALRCGHAHADALSFEFASDGVPWMVDPGTYTYTGDTVARDLFRTSAAHNTVVVDGLSQSVPDGPFSWHHIADASLVNFGGGNEPLFVKGGHNGYARLVSPVQHARTLFLRKRPQSGETPAYLLIEDVLNTSGRHQYEVRMHLCAGCDASIHSGIVRIAHDSGKHLVIGMRHRGERRAARDMTIRIEDGWVSRCYGSREPSLVIIGDVEAEGDVTILTLVVPVEAGERLDLDDLFPVEASAICPQPAHAYH